jgi:hypothetical protein
VEEARMEVEEGGSYCKVLEEERMAVEEGTIIR